MTAADRENPGRVVIRAPNWLGDVVMALPAMTAVRRRFPGAHLAVAAVPSVAAVFREDTGVRPDTVVELPQSARAAVAAIAAGRFDLGVLFPNSFRSAWELWRAGVPARWGYATGGRGLLLTRRAPRANRPGVMHQADYYRALVSGLGMRPDDERPRIAATEATRARAGALLDQLKVPSGAPLVGLAPGAAYGAAKQWPIDRVAALAARLVRERGMTCLVLGATHDRAVAREIESWLRASAPEAQPRVIDLAGRTSLSALVGIAARCDVFVSNDSGAMHVAAALGRPVVAVFGPTDERVTRPLGSHDVISERVFCRPCLLRECPIDHRCMKRITVDMVAAAVLTRLDARPVS